MNYLPAILAGPAATIKGLVASSFFAFFKGFLLDLVAMCFLRFPNAPVWGSATYMQINSHCLPPSCKTLQLVSFLPSNIRDAFNPAALKSLGR